MGIRDSARRQLLQFIASEEALTKPPPEFIDHEFEAQASFILDPSRQKAALCTRRSGKTFGVALYLLKVAFEQPHVQCLYLALTRPSAKAIMWPIMHRLNRDLQLGATFHSTELVVTLPNGSIIRITGADATPEQMERQLGQANALVAVDECASFRPYIRKLVYDVLKPTLVDHRGTLAMIGTPGEVPAGLFFDVTTGKEPGWSVHKWSTYDNPYMRVNWDAELTDMRERNPYVEETPTFRRNYLGEWVTDAENLVYKFNPERNYIDTELPPGTYTYLLGIDMGWEDPTAICVAAYSEQSDCFYILNVWKFQHMLLTDLASQITSLQAQYPVAHVVIDDASKQAVEEMRMRYSIPFQAAEKTGKSDFIGIMNDDLIMGKVKLCRDGVDVLITEWANLVWGESQSGTRTIDKRADDHAADSALYAFRYAKHYLSTKEAPVPEGAFSTHRLAEAALEEAAISRATALATDDYTWWEDL